MNFKLLSGYILFVKSKAENHDTFFRNSNSWTSTGSIRPTLEMQKNDFRESKFFVRGFRYGPHHVRGEHPLSSLFFEEIFKSRWWCQNVSNMFGIGFSPIKLGKIHPIRPAGYFSNLLVDEASTTLELVIAPRIPIETSIYGQLVKYSNSLPMNNCTPKTKKFPEKGHFNSRKGSSSTIV